jgi:hypothetical protein
VKLTPDQDRQFQALARTLDSRPKRKKASRAVRDALDEGYESLEMDPYLRRPIDDEEEDEDSVYIRDLLGSGAGLAQDYYLSFNAPLADLGDGQVDTYNKTKGESGTFTRATVASCRLKSGLLKKVASGVPRSHYLEDGTYGGYLAEGARTNLCLRSEEFDNASWVDTRASETANAAVAPDGTTTAEKLVEDATAANSHIVQQNFTFTAAVHTWSVFLKAGERTWARMLVFDGTTSYGGYFNLSTGVVGTVQNGATLSIESWGNGWYRCIVTTAAATAAAAGNCSVFIAEGDNDVTFDGDGASGIYVWGAQLEAAAFASSYIPTVAASVTRNADVLTYSANDNVGTTEGTLYLECVPDSVAGSTFPIMISVDNGTANEWIVVNSNNTAQIAYRVDDGGATQASFNCGAFNNRAANKVAVSYAVNDFAGSLNGAAVVTDVVGTIPSPTTIRIGMSPSNAQHAYCPIKNVRIWQRQMPDALLQSMTA